MDTPEEWPYSLLGSQGLLRYDLPTQTLCYLCFLPNSNRPPKFSWPISWASSEALPLLQLPAISPAPQKTEWNSINPWPALDDLTNHACLLSLTLDACYGQGMDTHHLGRAGRAGQHGLLLDPNQSRAFQTPSLSHPQFPGLWIREGSF